MPALDFIKYEAIFISELYRINDFTCYSAEPYIFKPGLNPEFSINIPRKGFFTYHTYRRKDEEYNSRIMVEKPGSEYKLVKELPGEGACTVILFTRAAYESIREQYRLKNFSFFNNSQFCGIFTATPETDYLHHLILRLLAKPNPRRLEIDGLVMELLDTVLHKLRGGLIHTGMPESTKQYHLTTIERAKEYLFENFTNDISLHELAQYCYVSPFHFVRLFKQVCTYSPFHYLQQIRLKHAETLLRTTDLPITDVCFRSGFNRLDYFSSSFTKKFALSPTKYRAALLH
jgi:AraC family transcriptional regulator